MDDQRKHLTPLRKRLEAVSKTEGIRLDVIQQDYLLTWILIGISRQEELRKSLIFKGGTALKKCYFGDYRFSEDLDFSSIPPCPQGDPLEKTLMHICDDLQNTLDKYAPISLEFQRYQEKHPHPFNQEAFVVRAQFPWQRMPLTKVMIEISHEEQLVLPPLEKPIIHSYEEEPHNSLLVYPLEEIISEKLRAILQNTKKIHEQGWGRSRVRDYYDLYYILTQFSSDISWRKINQSLSKKCEFKGIIYREAKDFFDPVFVKEAKNSWGQWLVPLSHNPPNFDTVLEKLQTLILSEVNVGL